MRPLDSRNEQSAEALTPLHVGVRAYRRWRSLQELVVESLVVSLTMVMLDVLVDGCLRRSLLIRPPLVVRTTMRAAATRPRQFRRPPQTRADGQAAL